MKTSIQDVMEITRQASRAIDSAETTSANLSRRNTSTLCGVVGGFSGMGFAYTLSLAFPVSFPIVAIIATGLGISAGVLSFRLARGISDEYRLDRNRVATDEILDRIRRLPPGTPREVRDELWNTYRALNSIGAVAITLPTPSRKSQASITNDRLLPPNDAP